MALELHRQRSRATTVTGLIILAFVVWLGLKAPRGTMWGTDELLTAERTREMLVTGERLVVHYNFHRSFEKPPLQYWLTSLTLPRFENHAVAVRIWPLVYGVLTALALAWLIRLVVPDEPWLMPLAIAILISSPLFSGECSRGLLDIGLGFFTTLVFVFAELARKRPAWWFAVALACWLGSLQKVPIPFFIWVLIVLARLRSRDERAELRKGAAPLIGSMLFAIAAMSVWPLLQTFKYGFSVSVFYDDEIVDWLGPTGLGRRPYFEIPMSLSLHPGGLCGFLSLIALFVVLFGRKEPWPRLAREFALIAFSFLVLVVISNFRDTRYVIPVLPLLCFVLALVLYRFLKRPQPVRAGAIVALIVLLTAGFVHAEIHMNKRRRNVVDEKIIAEKLGELQQPGTTTVLIKAIIPGHDLLWDSFYLFHGNCRFPVKKLTIDELQGKPPPPPLIGACIERDFPIVKALYPNVEVVLTRAQFICWRVPTE